MPTKNQSQFDLNDVGAIVVIAIAASIRIILISLGWPSTNSDEATMGLMARHIAYLGEHPVFMYGQNYMGSLESHIGAALFLLLGPSLFALRLGLVLLDVVFMIVMYRLVCLLYTRGLALFIVILLCFGSTETMLRQLKVLGGVVETMLFGSLLLLIATMLALSFQQQTSEGHRGQLTLRRLLLYACSGLVIGLGMWSHLLVLPFVGATLLLLLLFCWREFYRWLLLIIGFLIGFFPTIWFTITQHPAQNVITLFLKLHDSGGLITTLSYTFWDQIRGVVLISLPLATGFNSTCNLSADPGVWRSEISSCVLTQGVWGVCYLIVLGIAVVFAARELRRCYLVYRKSQRDDERRTLVYAVARAMLLVAGGLTLVAYLFSPAPALVPITSARYLVGLTVMLPTLLAPFWAAITGVVKRGQDRMRASRSLLQRKGRALVSGLVLLLLVVNYAISLIAVFQQVPSVQAGNQQQYTLVNDLLRAHITRIYSDYWTCNRVIFQSQERIICSVLDGQLQPGQNRYAPYQAIVQSDPHASYALVAGSIQAMAFAQKVVQTGATFSVMQMDGYIVYEPE